MTRVRSRNVRGVALLAEGVDRNVTSRYTMDSKDVALLAEGVDRNAADGL